MRFNWMPMAVLATGLLIPSTTRAGVLVAISLSQGHGPRVGSAFRDGFDNGYRDGEKKARQDVRRHRNFNLRRHRDFRNADRDARCKRGYRRAYAAGYRDGFERGYRRAYFAYADFGPRVHGRRSYEHRTNWFDDGPRDRRRW
jgi:hypothetical protein